MVILLWFTVRTKNKNKTKICFDPRKAINLRYSVDFFNEHFNSTELKVKDHYWKRKTFEDLLSQSLSNSIGSFRYNVMQTLPTREDFSNELCLLPFVDESHFGRENYSDDERMNYTECCAVSERRLNALFFCYWLSIQILSREQKKFAYVQDEKWNSKSDRFYLEFVSIMMMKLLFYMNIEIVLIDHWMRQSIKRKYGTTCVCGKWVLSLFEIYYHCY